MSVSSHQIEVAEYPPLELQLRMAGRSRKKVGRPLAAGKVRFFRAMRNTRGIKKLIADNLGISCQTVANLLERPDWADVREAWLAEKEQAIDTAEDTVLKAIEQWREVETPRGDKVMVGDADLATTTAKWLLSNSAPPNMARSKPRLSRGATSPSRSCRGLSI